MMRRLFLQRLGLMGLGVLGIDQLTQAANGVANRADGASSAESTSSATSAVDAAQGLRLGAAQPFSWNQLIATAQSLVAQPYVPRVAPQAEWVDQIDWAAHGQIHFKPDKALYRDGPGAFPVAFFHPGKFFPVAVQLYTLEPPSSPTTRTNAGHPEAAVGVPCVPSALNTDLEGNPLFAAREILYDPQLFDSPAESPARHLGPTTGFAGFKIQESRLGGPGQPGWQDNDWAAFLGASYFRAIGDAYQYGLSARGVAVNVAVAGETEEFPAFTRFYFEPDAQPDSHSLRIYALLEGASLTGAYCFTLTRDQAVLMHVQARLFLRRDIAQLGLAPMTSMYWYAKADRPRATDWRPEVHDSDGLALWTGAGEHLWRPLNNPAQVLTSHFADQHPKGFGLMQRERHFDHYLDAIHYERRPALWVEPLEDWGEGQVCLVEIPTKEEIYDNVVAFWLPAAPARAGASLALNYRLYWQTHAPYPHEQARCVATRLGRGGEAGPPRPEDVEKYVVEFSGSLLAQLPAGARPEPVLSAAQGQFTGVYVEPVPEGNPEHWRVVFDYPIPTTQAVDVRLFLRHGNTTLSETWLYQVLPRASRTS